MLCSKVECLTVRKKAKKEQFYSISEISKQLDKCNKCVFKGFSENTSKETRYFVGALYSRMFFMNNTR